MHADTGCKLAANPQLAQLMRYLPQICGIDSYLGSLDKLLQLYVPRWFMDVCIYWWEQ